MKRLVVAALLVCAVPLACSAPARRGTDAPADAGSPGDAGSSGDAGATPTDAGTTPDAGPTTVQEAEPNNGSTDTEFNALAAGQAMEGALSEAGDVDIFKLETTPDRVYRLALQAPAGSALDARLTVIDAGRDNESPGSDYVKIAHAPDGPSADLELLAMGDGGYFVIVRDRRGSVAGSPAHTYRLAVEDAGAALSLATQALSFPSRVQDALPSPGALRLYSFDGTLGADVRFDMRAGDSANLDGRLFVFAEATGDWIARNDDRSDGNPDPLLDAPLSAAGRMVLVVENLAEEAGGLHYTLDAARQ